MFAYPRCYFLILIFVLLAAAIGTLAITGYGRNPDGGHLTVADAITRWNSQDQGRIAFTSGRLNGPARGKLCIMSLPHREVSCVELPEELNAEYGSGAPVWVAYRPELVFAAPNRGEFGIFLMDLRDGITKQLSSGIRIPPLSERGERIPYRLKSGHSTFLDPPSYSRSDKSFEVTENDSCLYVLRNYRVCQGLPGWTIDPDTMRLESGERERLRMRLRRAAGERRLEWSELWRIDIDSSGLQSMMTDSLPFVGEEDSNEIVSLSATPDGLHIALSTHKSVAILDVRDWQSFQPTVPGEFDVRYARFSNDGAKLAACAVHAVYPQFSSTYVLVADGPDFSSFKPIAELSGLNPIRLAWSPDNSWLLAVCYPPAPAESGTELCVLEVETGKYFKLSKPYILDGMPADGLYVDGDIDWTR